MNKRRPGAALPGVDVAGRDGGLGQGQLVQVEQQQVTPAEERQHDAQRAEQQQGEGAVEHPPPHQPQEHQEVHARGQRGQHDAWGHGGSEVRLFRGWNMPSTRR